MVGRIGQLENLRREKKYQEVFDGITTQDIDSDPRFLPMKLDAGRGLVKRSSSLIEIIGVNERLVAMAGVFLGDVRYVKRVDVNPELGISHRRDFSRYLQVIKPAIDNRLGEESRLILEKAKLMVPENDWRVSLIEIEEQNNNAKSGRRVNFDKITGSLVDILRNAKKDPDRDTAVLTWSVEAALNKDVMMVNGVLEAASFRGTLKDKIGIITRAEIRLMAEKYRECLLITNRYDLLNEERKRVFNQLIEFCSIWK